MSEFSECTHGRTLNTCPVCRDTMRGYKELVEVQQARIEECQQANGRQYTMIEALKAQLTAQREGVQKHKDSFLGKESDIVPEDGELWALLEKNNE